MSDRTDKPSGKTTGRLFFAVGVADGVVRDANRELLGHTGVSPADIIGRPWIDLIHPDDHRGLAKARQRVAQEQSCRWTSRMRHGDGQYVMYHCEATLGGDATIAYVWASDNRVVRQEQDDMWQYARLSDLADDLFVVSDRLGNLVAVNAAAERLHGMDRKTCAGRPLIDYMPPEGAEIIAGIPARYLAGEETVRYTLPAYDFKGDLVTLECVTTFCKDTQRWYTVERNMTSRVLREKELEISQRFFDLSPSQLVLLDNEGCIERANHSFLSFAAMDHHRVIGAKIWEVLQNGPRGELRQVFERVRSGSGSETVVVPAGIAWQDRTLSVTITAADDGSTMFWSSRDITEEKRLADELLKRATHDQLTRLANRDVFDENLDAILSAGLRAGVIMIDLDEFKRVNDTLGHHAGDQLLALVGARLENAVRAEDLVARFGGDEFVVLLRGTRAETDAAAVAEKIRKTLSQPYNVSGRILHITISLGVATGSAETHSASKIFREADAAAYLAKRSGRNRSQVFDAELERTILDEQLIEAELRRALQDDQIDIDVQRIFTTDGTMTGVEAQVRLVSTEGERLGTERFLGVAAKLQLLGRLGEKATDRSLASMSDWLRCNPEMTLSLNIDPSEVASPGFVDFFTHAVRRHDVDPGRLIVQVTESGLLAPDRPASSALDHLRTSGVRVAIDDFGTGASSLGYLRDLRIDQLKIDRSFIDTINTDPTTEAIAGSLIDLAARLEVEVVAEGVSLQAQLDKLRDLGCPLVQGELLHRATPVDEFLAETALLGHRLVSPAADSDRQTGAR